MEFINKMKKREFIQMGLKAGAALLAAFLAIILMEGMIYGIELKALKTKSENSFAISSSTVAYCIKESDDQYFVLYYNKDNAKEWSSNKTLKTRAECESMEGTTVKEVVFNAPNAFVFSINPIHYVVMSIFILAVGGFFTYKFVALNNEYKKIEKEFKETGTIALG